MWEMEEFPYLTEYDPPGSSEGTLDPLGLYLIADQLATRLVPAVRERMQRIRFLTAMNVGALVTEGLESNARHPETPPYLVWEWLVVEAIVRSFGNAPDLLGVPGTYVTEKALSRYGYVDQRSYLKTPRVFGFNGVYKRLAIHLGLLDPHLQFQEPEGQELILKWSKDLGIGIFSPSHALYHKWRRAVEMSLDASPPRTRTNWRKEDWKQLAGAFLPNGAGASEKSFLREILHFKDERSLEALPEIWQLVADYGDNSESINERDLHRRLRLVAPRYALLLDAISSYEVFCRLLSDCFNILRFEAIKRDVEGLDLPSFGKNDEFARTAKQVHSSFQNAAEYLNELGPYMDVAFDDRFHRFAETVSPEELAAVLCQHHEAIQQGKSREGKRPWFDRLGVDRIYLRRNYRLSEPPVLSEDYVHDYRGNPIYRFYKDLS